MVTLGAQVAIEELMGKQRQTTRETEARGLLQHADSARAALAPRAANSLNAVKSRYNQNNKIIFVCFILASGLLAPSLVAGDSAGAPGAGATLPSKHGQDLPAKTALAVSVVRVGKNGHLVRALEAPEPAKGTLQVKSESRATAMIGQTALHANTPPNADSMASKPPVIAPVALPRRQLPASTPGTTPAAAPAAAADVAQFIDEAASTYSVDPLLVRSMMSVESNFNPLAVSPKGARGLMQLIPATARRFGVSDPFDARQNIEGGVKYLHYLQNLFPGDLRLSLAAYNAGEGAVSRFGDVPPYPETVDYVAKVKQRYNQAQQVRTGDAQSVANSSGTSGASALGPALPAAATDASAAVPVRHIEQYTDSEGRLYLRTR